MKISCRRRLAAHEITIDRHGGRWTENQPSSQILSICRFSCGSLLPRRKQNEQRQHRGSYRENRLLRSIHSHTIDPLPLSTKLEFSDIELHQLRCHIGRCLDATRLISVLNELELRFTGILDCIRSP